MDLTNAQQKTIKETKYLISFKICFIKPKVFKFGTLFFQYEHDDIVEVQYEQIL